MLVATIVANSGAGQDCAVQTLGGSSPDGGYSLADDASCGFTGTSLSDTPAGLDPAGFRNNGGPTETIELEPGSAAIEHITNAAYCLPTDQRGFSVKVPCDIGAYDGTSAIPPGGFHPPPPGGFRPPPPPPFVKQPPSRYEH